MNALIIILFVFLLIFFFKLLPLYVSFNYKDDVFLSVKYLFFEFKILPKNKVKKKTKKKKIKQKNDKKKPVEEKSSIFKSLKQIKDTISSIGLNEFLEVVKIIAILTKDFLYFKSYCYR